MDVHLLHPEFNEQGVWGDVEHMPHVFPAPATQGKELLHLGVSALSNIYPRQWE